jgi:hypothetical protein
MFKLGGKIAVIKPAQKITEKFTKREFVITDDTGQYPQMIQFQLTQERCEALDIVEVGDEVLAHFNVRGKEWKSPSGEMKYFNTLEVYKLEYINKEKNIQPTAEIPDADMDAPDDLPF